MSLKVAELYAELDLRSDRFDREMGGVKGRFAALGPVLAAAGAAAGAALAAGAYKGITAASDLAESVSKATVVFGESAAAVLAWSEDTATAMGMSRQQSLEAASTFGNLFVSMGLADDKSAGMSQSLVSLAGDLASFNNIDPTQALDALRSGLVGETEPMRRLGVNMNEATLKAQAFKMGLTESVTEGLTPAAKAQAAYALIMAQTETAQGDFARTSGGFANQMRILRAEVNDLFADVGKHLLPLATAVVKGIRAIISGVGPVIDGIRGLFAGGDAGLGGGMFQPLADAARSLGPIFAGIKDDLAGLWAIVGPALAKIADYMGPVLGKAIAYVAPIYREFAAVVAQQVRGVLDLANAIKRHWGTIVQFVGPVFTILATIISTAFKVIVDLVRAALALMRGDWSGAKAALVRIAQSLQGAVVAILRALGQLAVAIMRAAWGGIKSAASAGASAVVSLVKGLPRRIVGALGDLGRLLYSAGSELIGGLLSGIRDALDAVWDEVSSTAGRIKDTFTSVLGITSPSTVFRGYGVNLMEGLAGGIAAAAALPAAALAGAAGSLTVPKLSGGLTPFGGAAAALERRTVIEEHYHVHIPDGTALVGTAREVADVLAPHVVRAAARRGLQQARRS